jgi:hypothetical protein
MIICKEVRRLRRPPTFEKRSQHLCHQKIDVIVLSSNLSLWLYVTPSTQY